MNIYFSELITDSKKYKPEYGNIFIMQNVTRCLLDKQKRSIDIFFSNYDDYILDKIMTCGSLAIGFVDGTNFVWITNAKGLLSNGMHVYEKHCVNHLNFFAFDLLYSNNFMCCWDVVNDSDYDYSENWFNQVVWSNKVNIK